MGENPAKKALGLYMLAGNTVPSSSGKQLGRSMVDGEGAFETSTAPRRRPGK